MAWSALRGQVLRPSLLLPLSPFSKAAPLAAPSHPQRQQRQDKLTVTTVFVWHGALQGTRHGAGLCPPSVPPFCVLLEATPAGDTFPSNLQDLAASRAAQKQRKAP